MNNKAWSIASIILWSIILVVSTTVFFSLMGGNNSFGWNMRPDREAQGWTRAAKAADGQSTVTIAEDILDLDIEWISDNVALKKSTDGQLRIVQSSSTDAKDKDYFVYKIDGSKLFIEDARQNTGWFSGWNFWKNRRADLTIYLPEKLYGQLVIEVVSSQLSITDISVKELEIDCVSADANIAGSFENARVNSVSATVVFANSYQQNGGKMRFDTVSGDMTLRLSAMPADLRVDMVSGDIDITLPENDGFTLRKDLVTGDIDSDFAFNKDGDRQVYKNGGNCEIRIDGVNGDVVLYKSATTAPGTEVPKDPESSQDPNSQDSSSESSTTDLPQAA